MAVSSSANALSTTRELVFTATNGHSEAPEFVTFQNSDGTDLVYLGGNDVTASIGFRLGVGESITLELLGGDTVWAIASANTPSLRILSTRV